jgi:hypothetical protein
LLHHVDTIKEYHAIDPFLGGYDKRDSMSNFLKSLNSSDASKVWSEAILYNFRRESCKFRLHFGLSLDMASHFASTNSSRLHFSSYFLSINY